MRDFRPAAILASFFIMLTIVVTIANLDSITPSSKQKKAAKHQPEVSIESSISDTASADETLTCEIKVNLDSTQTTSEVVAVESVLNSFAGASFELVGAEPRFESTEQVPFGGGLKVNWGHFQMVGGDKLDIKLHLKPKSKGSITSIATAKVPGGSKVTSNNMITLIKGPALAGAITKEQTSTTMAQLLQPKVENHTSANSSRITKGTVTTQNDFGIINLKPIVPTTVNKSSTTGTTTSPKTKTTVRPKVTTQTTKKVAAKPTTTATTKTKQITKQTIKAAVKPAAKATTRTTVKPATAATGANIGSSGPGLMTKAEFVAALVRALGADRVGYEPFVDVSPGDWFYPAVSTAYNLDLIDDVSSHAFRPNAMITREDAAVMIVKAARVPLDTHDGAAVDSILNSFADDALISSWARPFVAASVKNNLLTGHPEGFFKPQAPITEAEALGVLSRLKPIS